MLAEMSVPRDCNMSQPQNPIVGVCISTRKRCYLYGYSTTFFSSSPIFYPLHFIMRLVPLFLLCILSQVLAQSVSTPAAAASSSSSSAVAGASSSVPSSSAPATAASNTSVATAASSVANAVSSAPAAAAPSTAPAPAAQSSTSWSLAQPLSTPSTGVQIPPVISSADNIRQSSVGYLAVICTLFMLVA